MLGNSARLRRCRSGSFLGIDVLKNAPMFKRFEARIRGKGSAIGVGRGGRAVAMHARLIYIFETGMASTGCMNRVEKQVLIIEDGEAHAAGAGGYVHCPLT